MIKYFIYLSQEQTVGTTIWQAKELFPVTCLAYGTKTSFLACEGKGESLKRF